METGTWKTKISLAQMLKGGVIMDVGLVIVRNSPWEFTMMTKMIIIRLVLILVFYIMA